MVFSKKSFVNNPTEETTRTMQIKMETLVKTRLIKLREGLDLILVLYHNFILRALCKLITYPFVGIPPAKPDRGKEEKEGQK